MRFYFQRKKRPGETIQIGVDFTTDMVSGDTIAAEDVSARTADGADAPTFIGAPAIDGKAVKVAITGGDDGTTYLVTFVATTALGHVLEHEIEVPVDAAA